MIYSKHILRACCFFALLFAAKPLCAQDLTAFLPTDEKVIKGKLPNGLTYYIRSNKKPEHKVELRLVVKAGSILEDPDQQGLAHFMEHMNFNGLKHFEKNELVNYLQSIGVEFGADLNASTGFDETIFILPIPTDKPGNLDKGFQIIEDWAHNALLTDKDIDDERGVVLEESRLGKGAEDRMMKKYLPKYASGTKYAERLPIGKDDILKTFKYDAIRRYYHDWYRPDIQAVMVVGDIDSATAMTEIMNHFSAISNPPSERKRDYVVPKPRLKPEAMVVSDKEAIRPSLQIIFPLIEKKGDVTLGDYRLSIERSLAAIIINHRLHDLSQSAKPPFAFASVNFDELIHGYETLTAATTFTSDGGVEKPLMALTAEMIRARDFGFTAAELDRAKAELMSVMDKMYNERKTTASQEYVDEYIRNFLSDEAMPGLENEYGFYRALMPGIKVEEVSALPKQWMGNMATFTLITSPQKPELKLPTDAALLALTQKGFAQKVEGNKAASAASSLLATLPTPGKVVSQNVEGDLGATTYTLSNGVKVTIKTTDFKSDEILLDGTRKGGTNNYGIADKANAHYAVATAAVMGFGDHTPTQLEEIMAGKVASVSMDMGEIDDNVSASSSVKDFEAMLQLLHLRMTAPRKDEELFDAFRLKQKQQLQFMSASPQVYFFDSTFNVLYKHNPLAPSPIPKPADFDALKMDRAMSIYRENFCNAKGFEFFLVGNVQPQVAIPLLEKYLGSLPASGVNPAFKDNGVRPIDGVRKLDIHKGAEKQSMIVALYHGDISYSEDLSLKVRAVTEVLNIKVIETLREKLGGIYTGGYQAEVVREPYQHYQIAMFLPCGPENVDKLLTAANEEIKNIQSKGIDPKDLEKVKSQWREKYLVEIKENKFWSDKLESILFWGRSRDHVLNYEKWIDQLTPADIQETTKMLFNGKNEFISVLNPES